MLAAPIVHGDSLYFSTIGGMTYRYLRATGKRVWARQLRATSAPWVVGDELFLSRRGKGIEEQIVVASADGKVLRTARQAKAEYLGDVPTSRPPDPVRDMVSPGCMPIDRTRTHACTGHARYAGEHAG